MLWQGPLGGFSSVISIQQNQRELRFCEHFLHYYPAIVQIQLLHIPHKSYEQVPMQRVRSCLVTIYNHISMWFRELLNRATHMTYTYSTPLYEV